MDLIAFGRAFINNPDMAERLRTGLQPVAQPTGDSRIADPEDPVRDAKQLFAVSGDQHDDHAGCGQRSTSK